MCPEAVKYRGRVAATNFRLAVREIKYRELVSKGSFRLVARSVVRGARIAKQVRRALSLKLTPRGHGDLTAKYIPSEGTSSGKESVAIVGPGSRSPKIHFVSSYANASPLQAYASGRNYYAGNYETVLF